MSIKISVKRPVSKISDGDKLRQITSMLELSPLEFMRKFKVLGKDYHDIEKGLCNFSIKSKCKIISNYPEISKIWLEYGQGRMDSGLYPNYKLVKLLEKLLDDKIEDLMYSEVIKSLSDYMGISYITFIELITCKSQMRNKDSINISKSLRINQYDLISNDLVELNPDPYVSRLLKVRINKIILKGPYIQIRSYGSAFYNFIYINLGDLSSKLYLELLYESGIHSGILRRVISDGSYIPNSSVIKILESYLKKYNLEFSSIEDLFPSINKSSDGMNKYYGPIYDIIKDKIKGWPINKIERECGIPRSTVYAHLHGRLQISKNMAERYNKSLDIPMSEFDDIISSYSNKLINDNVILRKMRLNKTLKYYCISHPLSNQKLIDVIESIDKINKDGLVNGIKFRTKTEGNIILIYLDDILSVRINYKYLSGYCSLDSMLSDLMNESMSIKKLSFKK